MTEEHKQYLQELADLMDKYEVREIYASICGEGYSTCVESIVHEFVGGAELKHDDMITPNELRQKALG